MGSPFYLAITNCHFSSYEMLLWLWIDVLHTYTHYRLNVATFAATILHCRLYLSLSHFHKDPLFFLHHSHSLTVVTKVVVLEFLQTKLNNSIKKKKKKTLPLPWGERSYCVYSLCYLGFPLAASEQNPEQFLVLL